jgi:hypothetical protein
LITADAQDAELQQEVIDLDTPDENFHSRGGFFPWP